MGDLIERARAAAQHSREFGPGTNAPLLDALADALEAAREDAERYRWLRVNEQDRSDAFLAFCFEELDAAIDAAREARNG